MPTRLTVKLLFSAVAVVKVPGKQEFTGVSHIMVILKTLPMMFCQESPPAQLILLVYVSGKKEMI